MTPAAAAFFVFALRRAGFSEREVETMPASTAFQFIHCMLFAEGVETRFAFPSAFDKIRDAQILRALQGR